MRVRTKLLTIILFVALVPLSVSAFTALRVHRAAYLDGLGDLRRSAAGSTSALLQQLVDESVRSVQPIPRSMKWAELSDDERDGALWLAFQQRDDIQVVSLFDGDGHPLGSSAYLSKASTESKFAGHTPVSDAFLRRWVTAARALLSGAGVIRVGTPFTADDGKTPVLPVAVSVSGTHGTRWTAAFAVSLSRVCSEVERASSEILDLLLLTSAGRLCHVHGAIQVPLRAVVGATRSLRYHDGNRTMLAASATMNTGWTVVAQQPAERAEAPSRRMRNQTIFWIVASVIVALAAGLFLAGSINKPVERLAAGADALASGDLEYRIDMAGGDELGDLARTFNHMGAELQRRNEEIEAWNLELRDRVEERTRELRDAQGQLLQAKKLAAVASLAAGVAHEINNPLTGVLGLSQLLINRLEKLDGRDRDLKALMGIEREAKRIRDIVQTLQGFAREEGDASFGPTDCNHALEESVAYLRPTLDQASIDVVIEQAPSLPSVHGSAGQLRQLMVNVIKNSITSMNGGGTLTLRTQTIGQELVKLTITDTGSGIAPENLDRVYEPFFTTKDDWQGRGLGLSVAFRIVDQHRGTIKLHSVVDEGTTVEVTLPAGSGGSHLV